MSEGQNLRLRQDDRAESRRVLVGARDRVQAMQDELARASRQLEDVD